MKNLLIIIFTSLSISSFSQSVVFVNIDATGSGDGSSWSDAYTSLDSAFANYSTGDTLWVKTGIYKPLAGGTNSNFSPPNGILMYGGFSGNESSLNQRTLGNMSVLDGNIGMNGSSSDNTRHVVFVNNNTSQIVIDGFKIRNGYAYTIGGSITVGGGGARIVSGNVKFENCEFSDNYTYMRGGAMAIYGSSSNVTLINCVFKNNLSNTGTSSGLGGAIFANSGVLKIIDCDFRTNTARRGGAISTFQPTVTIDRSQFSGNKASNNVGGAIDNGSESSLNIYNSLFVGNYAETNGSAIYTSTSLNTKTQRFIGCTFANNYNNVSSTSYTVYTSEYTTVANCIIYNNRATKQLFVLPPAIEPTVKNCLLEDTITIGSSIIYSSPEFINPGTTSSTPFTLDNLNYGLKSTSGAINKGDNNSVNSLYNKDLEGNARINSTKVDIGAIESQYVIYTIDTDVNISGSGVQSGAGSYLKDSTATLVTSRASNCYEFEYWTENDTIYSYDTTIQVVATSDRTFKAVYTQKEYTVTLSELPLGTGVVIGTGTYKCNNDSARSFTARANNCYSFKNWTLNGVEVSTDTTYSVVLSGDLNLVANFEYSEYQITANQNLIAGGSVTGGGSYKCDSIVTLKANANECYKFLHWKEEGVIISVDTEYVFKANNHRLINAIFEKEQIDVSVKIEPSNGGTITGAGIYDCGSTITLKANPASEHAFVSWEIDGITKSSSSTYQFSSNEDMLLTANFKKTGSISLLNESEIKVYPNPAKSTLNVESTIGIISNYKIINMIGEELNVEPHSETIKSSNLMIDVSSLSSGIYFILTTVNNKTQNFRFTID